MSSTFTREFGSESLIVETGKLALQANGSVLVRYGEVVLLVTAVTGTPREGIDFFPLTIDVEERPRWNRWHFPTALCESEPRSNGACGAARRLRGLGRQR